MVPENELQKVAVAIFAVMVAPKADHAATAALSMGHAGLRVPLLAMAPPAGKVPSCEEGMLLLNRSLPIICPLPCQGTLVGGGTEQHWFHFAANAVPGKVAEIAGSSAPPAGQDGASSSGPKKSDTAESFSKQGVMQALASMMAEKDIKVNSQYMPPPNTISDSVQVA